MKRASQPGRKKWYFITEKRIFKKEIFNNADMSSKMGTSKGKFHLITSARTLSRRDRVQEGGPAGQRGVVQGTIWREKIETSKEV